ncbi:distal tail protein Dit [Streptococcus intermedius]
MSGIGIKFNKIDILAELSKLGGSATTLDVNRGIIAQITNNYQEQGARRYGQQFLYNTLGVKQIPVSIKLTGTSTFFNKAAEKFGGLLNVESAKELIFGDEPNKVWMATPSGQPSLTFDNTTSPPTATLSVTFDIPDSYGENKAAAVVGSNLKSDYGTITKISNNHFKATLNNLGTAPAAPKITIKHNSENGWIGFTSAEGVYELGDPEEVDKKPVKKSEILFDYVSNNWITKGFAEGQKNVAILNDNGQNLNGTLAIDNTWGRPHIALTNRGSGSRPNNAGSITWEIPLDSNGEKGALKEYFWWRQIFWLGAANEYGFIKVTVSDAEDKFLYGVETFKRAYGLGCEYNVLVSDGKGGFRTAESWTFWGTHRDDQNPFNANRGWSDIIRRDDLLNVFWFGTRKDVSAPEIKGKKSTKLHVTLGTLTDKPQVTHMYLDSIVYRKDFIDKIEDIPNRYRMGSVVETDMSTSKSFCDNLPILDQMTDGSEPLLLPVGKSELDIYLSSWNEKEPDIKITWNERYV